MLVLNGDWRPWKLITWRKAITAVYLDKVIVVEEYEDWEVRSPTTAIKVPAVVVLKEFVNHRFHLQNCRENILARDNYTCQYCGKSAGELGIRKRDLEVDHVLPESRGGAWAWENLVTSCGNCNRAKSNRTPDEAGMTLSRRPFKPKSVNPLEFWLKDTRKHDSWYDYCQWLETEDD